MTQNISQITWTETDEAPALATYSLLPIVNAFTKAANVQVSCKDISLAGRILANFPENLTPEQKVADNLADLGKLTQFPEANIVKLPNISASVPQLKAALKELQEKGYKLPNYPENPETQEEKELIKRFAKNLGSAVNPVLREGNSDRRAAVSVKKFAQENPHKMMKPFSEKSKTHIAYMQSNDFYENEKSITLEKETNFKIQLLKKDGAIINLIDGQKALEGEILDATFMSKKALKAFYEEQIKDAKKQGVLLSLHLKATMMKVSDPVIFGHAVSVFYASILQKYKSTFRDLNLDFTNGLQDLYNKIETLPDALKSEIKADIQALYTTQPDLAMVDSAKGITNLHVPNNVIIDASMPVVIRDGGKMWNAKGELQDTKAMIPDRCYATFYQVVIQDCQKNGALNPATMGHVSNVGLMAQKAEEYGSHPTTFIIPADGKVQVIDQKGKILMESDVEADDIWRMSRTKDIPIQDWVKLAVSRARATGVPTLFWLDENRAHDAQIIKKVKKYLPNHDTKGLDIQIMSLDDAMRFTLKRVRKGENTISVSGNVLRDYLTDLFPIIELGTSAKMLSVVPLLKGGGLFETGAGGSAPKHVEQFLTEGHLRWDSLGEFLALTVSLEHLGNHYNNKKAIILGQTLDLAISNYLKNGKTPSRKAGELDNRGSHFFLAMYWAQALANQNDDKDLKVQFAKIAQEMAENKDKILKEIASVEGHKAELGGYFLLDKAKANKAMRPSATLNSIIDSI